MRSSFLLLKWVWLYTAKHRQRFKHFQRVLCARKTYCKLLVNWVVKGEWRKEDGLTLNQ